DVSVHFSAQALELLLNFLGRAAVLIDGDDALLEFDTRFNRAKNLVTRAEDAGKQLEFLGQQLVHALVGGIILIYEVDHHHIVTLTVTVTAPDTLLDVL